MSEPNPTVQIQEPTAPTSAPNAPVSAEKTFTQADVDRIVADRLARQRSQFADYETFKTKAAAYDAEKATFDAASAELDELKQANTLRRLREKVAAEIGVPAAVLTGTTEDECKAQATAILEFARPSGYPNVRDNGGVIGIGQMATRDQFKNWFNETIK